LEKARAIDANFKTWRILGVYIWPNKFVASSYSEEIGNLKDWISDRLIWFDGAIDGL